jgi:hypothetical protein
MTGTEIQEAMLMLEDCTETQATEENGNRFNDLTIAALPFPNSLYL